MSPEKRRRVARIGGLAAKRSKKKPHRWTSKEAAKAARRGHKNSPGPRTPRKHWGQHFDCKQCRQYIRDQEDND